MNERESRIIEAIRSTPNPGKTLDKVIDIVIDFIAEKKMLRNNDEKSLIIRKN